MTQPNELSASEQAILLLFRQPFRTLFLFGASFSVLAILLWGLVLNGILNMISMATPYFGIAMKCCLDSSQPSLSVFY
tara:strand:+ start:19455 stop:19688 length:234 start_codon:yes stop_codon:yes gene_type:complete